jgi:SAM-dependent methyltransferase
MSNPNESSKLEEDTFWEKTAQTRWGCYVSKIEKQVILKASNWAKSNSINTALEIGCEGGRWSKMLAEQGWSMVCTDINPECLEICQRKIPGAECILVAEEDRTILAEPSTVGLLLCIEVPQVINSDWFISEAFRVLNPDGFVVCVFQNRRSYRAYLHRLARSKRTVDYYGVVAYPEWRKKLCEQGFKLIDEVGFCWAPFSRHSNSMLIPLFTYLEQLLGLRQLTSISPWIIFIAQKDNLHTSSN